jgi:hypothetical protein
MRIRVEVTTMLGSTCVERAVVRVPRDCYPELPVRIPYGLGELIVTKAPRPTWELPRPPASARVIAFLGASFGVHLAILAAALAVPQPNKPPPRNRGASRSRLVANHTTQTRAKLAPDVVESVHDEDLAPERRLSDPTPPGTTKMALAEPDPGDDIEQQKPTEEARHFDPCANGDCGLIATSRFDTTTHGKQAGDAYTLPERHALDISVVECSVDNGCNTVSGNDQNDIRTAIAHHVAEVNKCFESYPAASASVDATVAEQGTVRVAGHDATSNCIATVIARLKLPGRERDVTLAFTSPS